MGGGKNRKNKRRRTGDNANDNGFTTTQNSGNGIPVGEDGLIPNGFTIDLGGNDFKKTSRRKSRFDDDNVDDSSEQAPRGGYGSQVLPFASDLPEDHTGEPLDGHEYLFLVRREAAAHPGVKTAEAFIARVQEEIVMSVPEASTSTTPTHRPSTEWRTSFLSRFSNVRNVMATSSSQPKYSDIPKHYTPIPAAQDESSWRTYINGRKGKERAAKQDQADMFVEVEPSDAINTGVAIVDHADSTTVNGTQHEASDVTNNLLETSVAVADASKPPAPASIVWTDPRPPIPTLMRSLDHYTIISLLEHFDGWLRDRLEDISSPLKPSTVFLPTSMQRKKRKPTQVGTTVVSVTPTPAMTEPIEPVIPTTPLVLTPLDSQWLFSLLTVLDPLLSSEDISTLRGLARTCREIADFTWHEQQKWSAKGAIEAELAKYKESIGGCWMVNAAIWEIWGQRDLWD